MYIAYNIYTYICTHTVYNTYREGERESIVLYYVLKLKSSPDLEKLEAMMILLDSILDRLASLESFMWKSV